MAVQEDKLFTLFVRYDDTLAAGKELAKFVDGAKSESAAPNDLAAGGDTRVGVEADGAGRAADGLIAGPFVFVSALTDASIISMVSAASESELTEMESQWWREPAMGSSMAI